MTRREFIASSAAIAIASSASAQTATAGRRMKIALTPGSIGVNVKNQRELNDLAYRHKFEAVEPMPGELAAMSADQMAETLGDLKAKNLVWAAAGLPVDFRGEDAAFREGMAKLPAIAAGLKRAGVGRMGTWLSPSHGKLTYLANFKQHADRLREVADRNQARLEAWEQSDFVRDADTLDSSLVPEGLVYPLPVPDAFWFDVGPDLT